MVRGQRPSYASGSRLTPERFAVTQTPLSSPPEQTLPGDLSMEHSRLPAEHRSWRGLRRKTLLIVGLTTVVLIGLLFLPLRRTFERYSLELEARAVVLDLERAVSAISGSQAALATVTTEYAARDEMLALVRQPAAPDLARLFGTPVFRALDVRVILVVDAANQPLSAALFDPDSQLPQPLPGDLQQALLLWLAGFQQQSSTVSGTLAVAGKPLLVAAAPLGSQPAAPGGFLVLGQWLDDEQMALIAARTQVEVQLFQLNQPLPAQAAAARVQLDAGMTRVIQPLNGEQVAIYGWLYDAAGEPAALLQVVQTRDIVAGGYQWVVQLGLALLIAGLVYALVMMSLLERFVLARVRGLHDDVQQINRQHDLGLRVAARGRDELAYLGHSINALLESLEHNSHVRTQHQQQLRQLNSDLEQRVAERTTALATLNIQLQNELAERQRVETALRASEGLNRSVLNALPAQLAVLDEAGTIILVNNAWTDFAQQHGGPDAQATGVGANYLAVCRRAGEANVHDGIAAVIARTRELYTTEYMCPTPDRDYWFWLYVTPLRAPGGGAVVAHLNITGRKQLEEEREHLVMQLRILAHTDALTGLQNRRAFLETAERELHRARRLAHPLALITFDIDHFKQINDTYGHAAGDKVLQAIAERCRQQVRSIDLVGRFGGEEFAVLLVEADLSEALDVAERLRICLLTEPIVVGDYQIAATASFGVVTLTDGATEIDALLRRADVALYAAKRSGRNRVAAYRSGSGGV